MGTVENTEAINNRQQVNFGGLEVENKNGYCDLHPDSKLVDGGPPWLLFQDGSDRAACNPFQIWRCSRSDCIRCYERSMFGYFNMDHARGSSVQPNALPQQRCYRHHQLSFDPFMFIGKIGTNRQFRCPVRGCENLGPEVAEHVADIDQAGEEPSVRPKRFSNETEKEAFELAVFHEFIKAAKLLWTGPRMQNRIIRISDAPSMDKSIGLSLDGLRMRLLLRKSKDRGLTIRGRSRSPKKNPL